MPSLLDEVCTSFKGSQEDTIGALKVGVSCLTAESGLNPKILLPWFVISKPERRGRTNTRLNADCKFSTKCLPSRKFHHHFDAFGQVNGVQPVLRLLQLFCEGHHTAMQNFLRPGLFSKHMAYEIISGHPRSFFLLFFANIFFNPHIHTISLSSRVYTTVHAVRSHPVCDTTFRVYLLV